MSISCVRCPLLRVDPAQRPRLEEIRDNLTARISEARREGWTGEAEGLKVSLAAANNKLAQVDGLVARRREAVSLGMPSFPDVAGRTASPVKEPAMTSPAVLAAGLRAHAQGLYCARSRRRAPHHPALAAPGRLHQPVHHRPPRHRQRCSRVAVIDWPAVIAALGSSLPCSGGEQRMLKITASLADGIPVDLRDTLTGLDDRNVQLLITAVLHASGQSPSRRRPR